MSGRYAQGFVATEKDGAQLHSTTKQKGARWQVRYLIYWNAASSTLSFLNVVRSF